jgi:hypothetical protein
MLVKLGRCVVAQGAACCSYSPCQQTWMQPLPQHLQIQLPLPLQPQGLLLPLHQLLPQQRHS